MAFVNNVQSIIRNSNGDIVNFYIQDKSLFYKEFISQKGWNNPKEFINNTDISNNQYDIKIDNEDRIYGVVQADEGNINYIYTEKNNILHKKLLKFDANKYTIKYPYIFKDSNTLHIIYYIQDIEIKGAWSIIHHYYDGDEWQQSQVTGLNSFPIINQFVAISKPSKLSIFYFSQIDGIEELFLTQFHQSTKDWSNPKQITNTKNKKIYLDVLYDELNAFNITWCENVDDNYIVKYMKYSNDSNSNNIDNIISISEPSNCSFPTFIKTNQVLWIVWTQTNRLLNSYTLNSSKSWSNPQVDSNSLEVNFIRYKFHSNLAKDKKAINLNNVFGTYYPRISFLGFKNIKS